MRESIKAWFRQVAPALCDFPMGKGDKRGGHCQAGQPLQCQCITGRAGGDAKSWWPPTTPPHWPPPDCVHMCACVPPKQPRTIWLNKNFQRLTLLDQSCEIPNQRCFSRTGPLQLGRCCCYCLFQATSGSGRSWCAVTLSEFKCMCVCVCVFLPLLFLDSNTSEQRNFDGARLKIKKKKKDDSGFNRAICECNATGTRCWGG